ncbi:surface-adhesin E family protein [Rhodanobacter sp. OR87]|uniref:surface-adhesin E family protein n=1 Tax=Rhodanobacter sp. OR87 TaxID=1076523 RepID=UPI0012DFA823|nr:surface-adhesin E family protein [Rhodanobacter sp. OR87]
MLAIAASCFTPAIAAATWYATTVASDNSLYFFDADTVERSPDAVVVWVKTVRISSPDEDGAWSVAQRWKFNCPARTVQVLTSSNYDNSGKFIRSNNNLSTPSLVLPDSTAERMLKIACEPSFPSDASSEKYWKLADNDIFEARNVYLHYQNSRIDTAPK